MVQIYGVIVFFFVSLLSINLDQDEAKKLDIRKYQVIASSNQGEKISFYNNGGDCYLTYKYENLSLHYYGELSRVSDGYELNIVTGFSVAVCKKRDKSRNTVQLRFLQDSITFAEFKLGTVTILEENKELVSFKIERFNEVHEIGKASDVVLVLEPPVSNINFRYDTDSISFNNEYTSVCIEGVSKSRTLKFSVDGSVIESEFFQNSENRFKIIEIKPDSINF